MNKINYYIILNIYQFLVLSITKFIIKFRFKFVNIVINIANNVNFTELTQVPIILMLNILFLKKV